MKDIVKFMKDEHVSQTCYESRDQVLWDTIDGLEGYFNRPRIHTLIDCFTPIEYTH
ncbi:integrase catalytic subunit [Burkholderia lata]|nr:integrase catalytic subunit [Burkholderia lata]